MGVVNPNQGAIYIDMDRETQTNTPTEADMERTQATPTKLRSGSWGAKVQSTNVREGDVVTITTRSGKSWDAQVSKVLWTGDGVAICATAKRSTGSRSRQSRDGNCSRCCRTATRTAQIWEDCPYCGAEPVYM